MCVIFDALEEAASKPSKAHGMHWIYLKFQVTEILLNPYGILVAHIESLN